MREKQNVKRVALAVVLSLAAAASGRADGVSRVGDVGAILLPAGAAVGALAVHDHQGLAQLLESYAASMSLVYVLKPTVDRTRPDGGSQSFPSGHAASAFAGAAFLQRRYGWQLGLPAYLLAGYVGYSRVEAKRHYTSDVLAGAAIGVAANFVFTHPRQHVAVALDAGRGQVGAELALSW